MRRGTCLLLAAAAIALPTAAQAPNPLIYDDPEYIWRDNREPDAPRPSPNALSGLQLGSTRVVVAYGSPGAKGRQVFGALVPWDTVWRTGANEATTLTTRGDLLIEGKRLERGTYSLFTIPGKSEWTVILNRKHNQWGAYAYDPAEDVLRFAVPSSEAPFRENFTIGFDRIDADGFATDLVLHWERTAIRFRLEEPD